MQKDPSTGWLVQLRQKPKSCVKHSFSKLPPVQKKKMLVKDAQPNDFAYPKI